MVNQFEYVGAKVEAIQFDGHNYYDVAQFVFSDLSMDYIKKNIQKDNTVKAFKLNRGDFLIKDSKGIFTTYTNKFFEKHFRKVEETLNA